MKSMLSQSNVFHWIHPHWEDTPNMVNWYGPRKRCICGMRPIVTNPTLRSFTKNKARWCKKCREYGRFYDVPNPPSHLWP